MKFADLCIGDVFKAYGGTFQKLPAIKTTEISEANAINTVAGQPAFFGQTVGVELVQRGDFERLAAHLQRLVTGNAAPA